MPKAKGIIKGWAGALWPYKFVTSILARLRTDYHDQFSIETHTPVAQISKHDDLYQVHTARGTIETRHVIHCTNGYVARLVPELLGNVFPVRGQMSAQIAPKDLPNNSHKHSWLLNYGAGFDYLTQLPVVEGTCNGQMMLGGGFVKSPYGGIQELGNPTDDCLEDGAEKHLREALGNVFDIEEKEADVEAMWTGTMGFSSDGLPWVGEVLETSNSVSPNQKSSGRQWVAAGYSGEGMVNTWLCGEALAKMVLSFEQDCREAVQDELAAWFPEEMLITKERMEKVTIPRTVPAKSEEIDSGSGYSTASMSPSTDGMQAAKA